MDADAVNDRMTRTIFRFAACAMGLMAVFMTGAAFAAPEKRVALVIGNSSYKNVARLPNPERDASAMAALFKDAGFDSVMLATDVGNLDFKRAIRKFEDASTDADIAVVFYAGHGIEVGGVNYLVPVDARLASDRDAQDEAISLERLVESVDGAKRLRLIILDACRDDPFVATMKRVRRTASRAIAAGLGKVEPASTDTLIAYAAKAGSTAEDGDGQHSPFTTALLANLTVPGLDVRLAFGRVRDQVMKITASRQEPFVYGSLGGGNIALVPAPDVSKDADDLAKVKTDYELVAQIGTKKAWEVFLNTYRTGFYADLARAQLAKLGAEAGSAGASPQVASLGPTPAPAAKPSNDEQRAWTRVRDGDKEALEGFIRRYPNSPLAVNAQQRLDGLEHAAREREGKARAEREAASKRAEEERRAKETARVAALQRAEEERHAKEAAREAARLAAIRVETERKASLAAASEKKKLQEQAALQLENELRAKEAADAASRRVKEQGTREAACKREQGALDDLKAKDASPAVRSEMQQLLGGLSCEPLRPFVVASIANLEASLDQKAAAAPAADTPLLVASAQKELTRLGCYSGSADGNLDAATKIAIRKYHSEKGEPASDVSVTESLVAEFGKQKLRVCAAAVVGMPDREQELRQKQANQQEHEKELLQQSRQRANGGIGVGF
jgi:hypothetical protein